MTRVSNPEGSKAGPLLYITVLNKICANGCVKQPVADALMPDELIVNSSPCTCFKSKKK